MPIYKNQSTTELPPNFHIDSHGASDTGHVRSRNEDSYLVLSDQNMWVVADGMGGHQAGEFASQSITQNLGFFKQASSLNDTILLLEENIINSNTQIRDKAAKLGKNTTIGATVVCVYIWRNHLFTFWAGDSRLYRFRDDQLSRLTEDHSYVEELVKMGKIEAGEAEAHPASNVVLRAVGIADNLCLDFEYFDLLDGDIFIICSDGLYKDLDEEKFLSIVRQHRDDMDALTQTLLSSSLDAGGTDNTSVITIKVSNKQENV